MVYFTLNVVILDQDASERWILDPDGTEVPQGSD